jgi:DHA3 family macrolide efflux protein-like MFS transporter
MNESNKENVNAAGNVEELIGNIKASDWKKKTALFLSGQAVSLLGSALVQYAIIWYITLNTRSGQMMTISAVFGFLPQIAISLFAGVWADRYNRKQLIIMADALIAASTLAMAV